MSRAGDDGTPGLDLEAEVDRLYTVTPGGFVAARDDLARRLRAAGRREDAAGVKRLRRPTVAAWALNQLSRRRGDDVRRLVQHGEELRRLQDELLAGGDSDRLRAATRARRAALDALGDASLELLATEAGTAAEGHRDEVLATLESASLEPDAGAALLGGHLTTGLTPLPGLGLLNRPSPEPSPRPADREGTEGGGGDDGAAHEARLAEARNVLAEATALASRRLAEAAAAAQEATAARRTAEAAQEEVARLTHELDLARRSAGETARHAEQAASRAADAERAASAAEKQAVDARAALALLEAAEPGSIPLR